MVVVVVVVVVVVAYFFFVSEADWSVTQAIMCVLSTRRHK